MLVNHPISATLDLNTIAINCPGDHFVMNMWLIQKGFLATTSLCISRICAVNAIAIENKLELKDQESDTTC